MVADSSRSKQNDLLDLRYIKEQLESRASTVRKNRLSHRKQSPVPSLMQGAPCSPQCTTQKRDCADSLTRTLPYAACSASDMGHTRLLAERRRTSSAPQIAAVSPARSYRRPVATEVTSPVVTFRVAAWAERTRDQPVGVLCGVSTGSPAIHSCSVLLGRMVTRASPLIVQSACEATCSRDRKVLAKSSSRERLRNHWPIGA